MPYVWIFLGCYAAAFLTVNMKMAAQTAGIKARLREIGASVTDFDANVRADMPLHKEILIRAWAPFVFSVLPTALLSLGYFIFS
jgi:hypothetical protein